MTGRSLARRFAETFMIFCVLASIAHAEEAKSRPKDFGMQWVRSHPFTITAPVLTASTFDLETYKGAGLNTLQMWENEESVVKTAAEAGVPWILHSANRRNPANDDFKQLVALE